MRPAFSLIGTLLFTATLQAATLDTEVASPSRGLRLIPTAGITSFSLSAPELEAPLQNEVGATAGLLVDLGRGPLKAQLGLLYMQTGFGMGLPRGLDASYVAHSLALPVMAKYHFYDPYGDQQAGLFVKGGVVGSRVVSSTTSLDYHKHILYSTTEASGLADTDVMASAGIGAMLGDYSVPWTIELTGYRGLLSLDPRADIYNAGLSVAIGTVFDL